MSSESRSTADATQRVSAEVGSDQEGEPLLEVRNLKKYFQESEGFFDRIIGDVGQIRAVDGVDLTIREGETVAVVGESGCGKSTLGQTILNLHQPTDGTVRFKGEDITGLSRKQMRPYRRDMQIIFQDPLASLNPRRTVGKIITAPMEVHDIGDSDEERTERAEALLERVGLKRSHFDRYPHQFSGGQQQRIGVARALALEPDLIIADEPVSALDVSVQAQILNLLSDLQEELGVSLLFIAHDLSVVRLIADRVAVMYLGEVVETAPVEELFENPQHPYTRSLLSAVPRIDPAARGNRIILRGTVPSPLDPPSGCRFHTRCPVVIPPEDWPSDQESFKAAFTFRNRLLADELDPEGVRTRLESADTPATDEAIVDRLIETALPGDREELPPDARTVVEEATRALVAGDGADPEEIVRDAFPSPCEDDPRAVEAGPDHLASCHRIDERAPGEPMWPD